MWFFLCPSQLNFFFQKDTQIIWVKNQYLRIPPQMLHNVNDKFLFHTQIDISNTQLYFTFNVRDRSLIMGSGDGQQVAMSGGQKFAYVS